MSGDHNDRPAEWRSAQLADCAEILMGHSPKGHTYNTNGIGVPLLNGPAEFGSRFPTAVQWTTAPNRMAAVGDILFCVRGNTTGRMNRADKSFCIGRGLAGIRGKPGHSDTEFVSFLLEFIKPRIYDVAIGGGSTFPNISRSSLLEFVVPLPPLAEQRQIAAVLGLVQRAVEQQERLIALTTELKKALLHQLFTEGLRGEPQKQTEIGPVPQSWAVVPLKTLLTEPLRNGHSAKASSNEDGIRTLTLTAVTRRDFSVENTKLTVADPHRVRDMWLRRGDILVERANTFEYVGLTALYEGPSDFAIYPDLMIRVRVDENRIRAKFLAEFLITPVCRSYFQKQARSTAGNFPKIDQGTVEQTLVPIPSGEEQNEIVSLLTQVDRKEDVHRRKHASLTDLFRTLLHQLMTAQLRVADLDVEGLLAQAVPEPNAAQP